MGCLAQLLTAGHTLDEYGVYSPLLKIEDGAQVRSAGSTSLTGLVVAAAQRCQAR